MSRFVTCVVLGFVVAGFLTVAAPCMADEHGSGPALSTPAGEQATEAELKQMGEEVGEATGELVHKAIEHPVAHGEKVNPNPLEWRRDLAMWTAVVFVTVFGLLYKFAWGPITEGLDKREKCIADDIASARKSNEEARALLEEYQARLDTAEGEVKAMLDKARADANRTGEKIVEAAKVAAEAEQKRALAEIDQATVGALSELAAKSADLAVDLASKIIKSELKASNHATLVSEAVSNFGKSK